MKHEREFGTSYFHNPHSHYKRTPSTTTHSLQPSKYVLQKFMVDTNIFVANYIRFLVNRRQQKGEILVCSRLHALGNLKIPRLRFIFSAKVWGDLGAVVLFFGICTPSISRQLTSFPSTPCNLASAHRSPLLLPGPLLLTPPLHR
jgi:hypothetical protein